MMNTDYPDLYRQLAREIVKHEGKIEGDAKAFVVKLAEKLRAEGYQLTAEIERELTDYLSAMQTEIRAGIESAVTLAVGNLPNMPQSATVSKLAEQAFNEQWPDGLKLSDRLWNWDENARTGLTQVLRDGVKTGASVSKTVYSMQRAIERAGSANAPGNADTSAIPGGRGQRFKIVERYADDWVKELHEAATAMIHDPGAKELWQATVADVEERILSLKATGTRSAAERVFSQIKLAVEKGREELADKAVKWWLYDKQLYGLKRIARTEMATAMHRAVIAGTEADDTIIGYQWRLSASHPATDICDYYASVEMGLGKGVFSKDAVPRHKAHPHCMCLLIPRVTQIRQKGDKNYADWIKNLSADKRQEVLPKWAAEGIANGIDLNRLIKPDGLGLISKQKATRMLNFNHAERLVDKLSNQLKDANGLPDIWANKHTLRGHIDKRVELGHIKDAADYSEKINATLHGATTFNFVGGKYALVEFVGNDWSVILNHNGRIKTAYAHEADTETFTQIQSRLGHKVYEYHLDATLRDQLKKLRDIR